jgi:hypothetical protein
MLDDVAFVKSTNSVTGEVQEYPPAIVDMEATVKINGEFDKEAIDDWLRTALTEVFELGRKEVLQNPPHCRDCACSY